MTDPIIDLRDDRRDDLLPRTYRPPHWVVKTATNARLAASIIESLDPIRVGRVLAGTDDPRHLADVLHSLAEYEAGQRNGMTPINHKSLPIQFPQLSTIRFDVVYMGWFIGDRCRTCGYPMTRQWGQLYGMAMMKLRSRNPRYCIGCDAARCGLSMEGAAKDFVESCRKYMRRVASKMIRDESNSDDDIVRACADEVWCFYDQWIALTKWHIPLRFLSTLAVTQAKEVLGQLKATLRIGSTYETLEAAWAIEDDDA